MGCVGGVVWGLGMIAGYSGQPFGGTAVFVSWFLQPAHGQHIYFFERQEKNKRAASQQHEAKTPATKTGGSNFT
jgi:hypothetical protein